MLLFFKIVLFKNHGKCDQKYIFFKIRNLLFLSARIYNGLWESCKFSVESAGIADAIL